MKTLSFTDVILREKEQLRQRRKKLNIEHGSPGQENWFGIALSGGGIRSATINLGILKTLNRFGILKKADYLSSVSGGGYTHAYVQGTTKALGSMDKLFNDEHINAMRQHGEYLTPGTGIWKLANSLLLLVAVAISWLMSVLSPAIVAGILYYAYHILAGMLDANPLEGTGNMAADMARWVLYLCGGVFALHFIINILLNFHLGVSKFFNKLESVAAVGLLVAYAWLLAADWNWHSGEPEVRLADLLKMVTLFVLGFYINPNAISLHRFYRNQLANLYLQFSGPFKNMPLHQVFDAESDDPKKYQAPYPLINTCLNLQSPGGDEKFKGVKASDYFLLSPLHCGSKLTGYRPTTFYDDYRNLTLPAAVTISAAAVNPGMGMYSSKPLSVLMTLFNARFGCWVSNPLVLKKAYALVWWPIYFFKELLGRIGSGNKMVNISDGGHIENFGAYELLRRGCRLILSVDAGEDRNYVFADLNNFILRARNELGLEIRFRDDQQPEDIIRPRPSRVYSEQRFAIADIYQWWEDDKIVDRAVQTTEQTGIVNFKEERKIGTFVYIKSSVTAPAGKPPLNKNDELKYGTYKYKIYHPEFPHESTSDQFFDPIQWESYFQLGQYIGADILGLRNLKGFEETAPDITVERLIDWFDDPDNCPLFKAKRAADESAVLESYGRSAEPPEVQYRM
ncbi:MAG: hypothetical protein JNK89_00170 [Saprospiraceae bacterium]|nr:hypothetical protein [Saprospiraceae bacterium]